MPYVHLPFVFRSFDLFVASLLFMKGILYCVLCEEKSRAIMLLRQIFRGHRYAWFPLLSACCFLEFNMSIICHVLMYCFGSFLLQDLFNKTPSIWGTTYEINCERVAYSRSILRRRARRLWLGLFASTVGRFLSQISSLSFYVFLRRLRSFASSKL